MGTNYELYYNKCQCCGRSDSIHIGKSSAGWRFIFQKHEGVVENIAQLKELTAKGEIVDEYGRTISNEDFWKLVEAKQTEKNSQASEVIDGYDFAPYEFS